MKRHEFYYRDIDRLLRIIYRELVFEHFNQPIAVTNYSEILEKFNLNNRGFQTEVINKYLQVYPDNYNREDLEILLSNLADILKKKYGSANTVYLIFLVSNEIFHQSNKELYVDFFDLLEWDGYRNKLDTKLFLSAYVIQKDIKMNQTHLNSVLVHNNKRIYDIMRRNGLSENHMHLKASGYTEEINWRSFVKKGLSDIGRYEQFINSDGIFKEFRKTAEKKNELLQFVLKFKVIRIILSCYLRRHLPCYLRGDNDEIITIFKKNSDRILKSQDVINTLSAVGLYQKMRIFEDIENILQNKKYPANDLTSFALSESDFMKQLMECIYEDKGNSDFICYLFNLYIAGMTTLKFQFVQDNLGMGFSRFKEKEDNKNHFVDDKDSDRAIIRSVFHKYYREKYIQKIELRIGPKESISEYVSLIDDIDRYNKEEFEKAKSEINGTGLTLNIIRYGLIIHFIKMLKKPNEDHITDQYNKRMDLNSKSDFLLEGIKYLENNRENKIIGIDTANFEENNRPELFGPTYRKIRNCSPKSGVIGATFHVGEEFPTLCNGLRAIDEVLQFLEYRANDRLGHALALGIDPDHYFKVKRNNILCSLGGYLDDLVWLYAILLEGGSNATLLLYLRDEFDKYKFQLFEPTLPCDEIPTFEDYLASNYLRGDCPDTHFNLKNASYDNLRLYGYKFNLNNKHHKQAFLNEKARNLFLRYSFDPNYREHAESPFQTKITDKYIECVRLAQRLLKIKIRDMHVYIEANPTSNKKISIMTKYSEIPALAISGPALVGDEDSIQLAVSINTDDSSIFQTNLVNEYSLVAASLLKEGYPENDVYDYIEELAIASNVHSFIE
jgi:cell fate (sporulation/competence/biofilm development) regulator YmcA (YheA/YmcA/DUF963 family)